MDPQRGFEIDPSPPLLHHPFCVRVGSPGFFGPMNCADADFEPFLVQGCGSVPAESRKSIPVINMDILKINLNSVQPIPPADLEHGGDDPLLDLLVIDDL